MDRPPLREINKVNADGTTVTIPFFALDFEQMKREADGAVSWPKNKPKRQTSAQKPAATSAQKDREAMLKMPFVPMDHEQMRREAENESRAASTSKKLQSKEAPTHRKSTARKSLSFRPSYVTKPKMTLPTLKSATRKTPKCTPTKFPSLAPKNESPLALFLELEKQCSDSSPKDSRVAKQIADILDRDRQLFESYEKQHAENMKQIRDLLKSGEMKDVDRKKHGFLPPTNDLRYKAFNNLISQKNDMYNSMKLEFSVLNTPKHREKTLKERELAEKLQTQCRLLDTPIKY